MRGLRPWRPGAVGLVIVAMSLITLLLSRTTGSGWLLVLVSWMIALVVVGAVVPALRLVRLAPTASAPADATVGRPLVVALSVAGKARGVRMRLVQPASEWARADAPAEGRLVARPLRRGVVGHVELEAASAAPFGLVWWRRRWRLALDRAVHVGPSPVDAPAPRPTGPSGEDRADGSVAHSADLVRSLREYSPGDPLRLVSWPATARHGRPMVKELESPGQARLTLVVELRGDEEQVERTASVAAGMANAALASGIPVFLLTAEDNGPRRGPVGSPVEVGRRLARAVPGPPPEPPAGGDDVVVRVAP